MNPATILERAKAEGVTLILSPAGTLKATGDGAAVNRWLPVIREHKPGIVAALQEAANEDTLPGPVMEAREQYTEADLAEMDRLLGELAKLERWAPGELEHRLDERRRMAPVNVPAALDALRVAHSAALAGWPEKPAERALIVLCRLVN